MTDATRLAELRELAKAHARQLEAVVWLSVGDLAVRWNVSPATVRKVSRDALPYLTLGGSSVRRYDPRDVEHYEAESKRGSAA
jgi:hypothetical protein